MKSGSLNFLEPSGQLRACNETALPLPLPFMCLRTNNDYFILIRVPYIFYYFVLCPTNAQLFHKLSHTYMFRHYRVIFRKLVINTLSSYTNISNAAVGNTIYVQTAAFDIPV